MACPSALAAALRSAQRLCPLMANMCSKSRWRARRASRDQLEITVDGARAQLVDVGDKP